MLNHSTTTLAGFRTPKSYRQTLRVPISNDRPMPRLTQSD